MKLAVVAAFVLGLGGIAHANPQGPQRAQRAQLRQMLLERFDRNHDGRLEPRERKRAARALHRMANRLGRDNKRGARAQRHARFIQHYDLNGDGNVGPGEMPPALANELRPLDRDGDGWVEDNELP